MIMSRLLSRHRSLVEVIVANVINNSATFVALFLFSRLATPDEFGLVTLYVSFSMTLSFMLDFGTGVSLVRSYNTACDESARSLILASAFAFRAATSILVIVALFLIYSFDTVADKVDAHPLAVVSIAACAISLSWWAGLRSLLQADHDYKKYSRITIGMSVIRLVIVALFFYGETYAAVYYLLGLYCLAPAIMAGIGLVSVARSGLLCGHKPIVRMRSIVDLISYGKWMYGSMLLFPLVTSLPLWFLAEMKGLSGAGAYGIGLMFANAVAPLRDAIRVYMLPKVVSFSSDHEANQLLGHLKKSAKLIPLFTICGAGGAVAVNQLLNGNKYEDVVVVIVVMIFVQTITLYTNLFGSLLHYLGKPNIDFYVNVLRVFVSAFLSVMIIPDYGPAGAAVSSGVSVLFGEWLIYAYVSSALTRRSGL